MTDLLLVGFFFTLFNLIILGINIKIYSEIVKTAKLSQIAEKPISDIWRQYEK